MAITNFISTVWSENLFRELDKQYIAAANCNRDYEGEIREKGSAVRICGLDPVSISDYEKNMDISAPEQLKDNVRDLVIDQAKYFNFAIDDIDRAQSSPKLMELAVKNAANALANAADAHILEVCRTGCAYMIPKNELVTPETVLDGFFEARTLLMQHNVSDPSDIIFEVSPKVAEMILRAKIDLGNTNEAMERGCIGNIAGCKVFVSNNIPVTDEADGPFHHCVARTKRAVAFAEQLSEIEAYRPESRFADAVKGLHLYGAKVVYPHEVIGLGITTSR